MIIKSKSYKHNGAYKTLVQYLLRESERDEGFVFTRFIKGKNPTQQQIIQAFEQNETYRLTKRKNSVKVYMEILSFHKDNAKDLSNEKLQKIARKYISLRSNLSVALATVHRNEKDHVHLHILLSGTEYKTGRSVRISRDDFENKVKISAEKYVRQNFPELQRSAIHHQGTLSPKKKP